MSEVLSVLINHGIDVVIGGAVVGGAWSMQGIRREIKYNTIRIVSLAHALELESKNGFGQAYRSKRKELMEEHNFKHNKGIKD
jgi:hypothetical protein